MKQKQLLKPLFLLCALLVGGLNSVWAEEAVYSTCLFGSDYNSQKVSSYTDTWTTTNGGFTWSIANGNNNNNGWAFVKFGRKNTESVGSITTSDAYTEAITKVDLTIDAITADKINSIKLYTSSNNSTWTEVGSFTIATGKQSLSLSSPTKNLYYKIEFDCASGSANGLITISKVEYYYEANTSDTRTATTTTIDKSGINNTDVYAGTSAGSLAATVVAGGNPVDGATITWSGNNDAVATIDASNGAVTLVGAGTVTFTASYAGDDNYKPSSATYEMTVTNDDPNASGTETNPYTVAQARAAIDAGTGMTGVYVKGTVSEIVTAYSSQYGNISYNISADGTTTSDQLQAYRGKSYNGADFTSENDIKVGDVVVVYGNLKKYNDIYEFDSNNQLVSLNREGSATAPSGDALFNETFDQLNGTGGRDNTFSGSVGTSSTTDKLDEIWTTIGNNGANKCIKLGTGSAAGTVTTGNIELTGNGTLTFSAAGWGTGENAITVEATGAELSGDTKVTLTNGEWKNYTVSITNVTGEVAITFTMKRGFLDDVKVVAEGSLPTAPTVTLAASGYASYCCEYPLDLDKLENDNVKAYIVTDVNDEDVTFTQLTGKIKGGVPFILYGTPNFECQLTYTDSDVVPSGNMLVGTLAPTYVTAGNIYGLSGGQFKKINTGVMKANKAYLATTSNAPALNIIFDEDGTTGIRSIDNGQLTIDNVYYDLSGRRIEKPTKGLYIVNGKKVILK